MKLTILTRQNMGLIASTCVANLREMGVEFAPDADVLLSLQYDRILSAEELSKYKMAFNLHNAKLPDYRGFYCINHAILNRERFYWSTIHWMTEEVDNGEIAYELPTKIDKRETAHSLYHKTVKACVALVARLIIDLSLGIEPPRRAQEGAGVFYGKKVSEYKRIASEEEIDRKARAWYFPPYPPAYIELPEGCFEVIPR